jgi:hypothetical protein
MREIVIFYVWCNENEIIGFRSDVSVTTAERRSLQNKALFKERQIFLARLQNGVSSDKELDSICVVWLHKVILNYREDQLNVRTVHCLFGYNQHYALIIISA